MPKIDVEIDSWLQDAIAYDLKNLVREKVRMEHRVSENTHIEVYSPEFSYGTIDIRWGFGLYPNNEIGFESFSLKEVLSMIMRSGDTKEEQ
jgi:hypothetical protein